MLTIFEQIHKLIERSSSAVICVPKNPSTDAIASGLALVCVLEKMNKKGRIVATNFQLPSNHAFLPKSQEIEQELSALRQFIISLNLREKTIEDVRYNIHENKLNIFISPKNGFFDNEDVTTSAGPYAYDLIITIDCQNFEDLGAIYEQNADFFYHTPVINIDHNPANEHFGQINCVQLTATSVSEIIFEFLESGNKKFLLDEYVATALLAGMISKTKSFRTAGVTPRSLAIASHLISQGGRREEIVRHLYQSKDIATLQLWGRVLAKLQVDKKRKIVWALLDSTDITKKEEIDELPQVIDELLVDTPDAKHIVLLLEGEGMIKGFVSTAKFINCLELFSDFQAKGSSYFVTIEIEGKNLNAATEMILAKLKKEIDRNLGL